MCSSMVIFMKRSTCIKLSILSILNSPIMSIVCINHSLGWSKPLRLGSHVSNSFLHVDTSLFKYCHGSHVLIHLLHVDDIILTRSSQSLIVSLLSFLKNLPWRTLVLSTSFLEYEPLAISTIYSSPNICISLMFFTSLAWVIPL